MTIREYIDTFSCGEMKELAIKLCKKYGADLDDDSYCYETESGSYLHGEFLSLGEILKVMEHIY